MTINSYQKLVDNLRLYSRKYQLLLVSKAVLLLIGVELLLILTCLLIEYQFYTSGYTRFLFLLITLIAALLVLGLFMLKPLLVLLGIRKQKPIDFALLVTQHFPQMEDKLVNIIELGEGENQGELVRSSVAQKIGNLSHFSFAGYFQFGLLRSEFFTLVWGLVLFVSGLAIFPNLVSESGGRILHFNRVFSREAPYDFVILNDNFEVRKGGQLGLKVKCEGRNLPTNLYVNIGGNNFLMTELDSVFTYQLEHVQNEFEVYFTDLEYVSSYYKISVIPDPVILSFDINVAVPAYTKLQGFKVENSGNIEVPAGSVVSWNFHCDDTDHLYFITDNDTLESVNEDGIFTVDYRCRQSFDYRIMLSNSEVEAEEVINFKVKVVPDQFPEIKVVAQQDSTNLNRYYIKGAVGDDYGFSSLDFVLRYAGVDSVSGIRILPNLTYQEFYYFIDFNEFRNLGDHFTYYFQVRDNDQVNGFKKATSEAYSFDFLSDEQLKQQNDELFELLEKEHADSKRLLKELEDDIEDFQYQSIANNLNELEKQQFMNKLLQKRQALEQSVKKMAGTNSKLNNLVNSNSEVKDELLQKQQQIEELMEQVMTDELRDLFDQLSELAQEFNQEELDDWLKKADAPMEDLSKQLDRNLQMLKKMQVEQGLEKLASALENIAKKEKDNKKMLSDKDFEKLTEAEKENQDKIKSLQDELESIREENKELERPLNLFPTDEEFDQINQQYQEINESVGAKKKRKAEEQIQKNSEMIGQLAFSIQQMLEQNSMAQQTEDINNIKQILKNVLYLSLRQEEVLNLTRDLSIQDPLLTTIQRNQDLLLVQSKQVEDSLYALAKRTPAISSKINSELLKINYSNEEVIENLKENQIGSALKQQQNSITAYNELALFLNEALENLEKAMASSMPGDQQCDKPGNSKSPGFGKLKDAQQSLKDQLQQMIESLKNGENGKLSEQIGKSLMQQEMVKSMINDLLMDEGIGSSAKEQLRGIENLIEQNRVDLIQKNLTQNMVTRQNLILDRLLKAEKSEMERDVDQERESQTAEEIFYRNKEMYLEYKQEEKNSKEELLFNNLKMRYFYDKKYRSYINELN